MKNLSGSKLPIFFQCGWAFRDDSSYPERERSSAAWLGSAVHAAAACIVKDGVLPNIDAILEKHPDVSRSELIAHVDTLAPDLLAVRDCAPLAEPAFAYHPKHGSARLLGLDIDRKYAEHGCDLKVEIPGALDLTFTLDGVLTVVDYKTGYADHVESPLENKQLLFGLLCAAKHTGHHAGRVETWFVRPGRVWKEGANVSMFDLQAFEDELKSRLTLLPGAAPLAGDHCKFCPARGACPATAEHLGAIVHDSRHRWSTSIIDHAHASWMAQRMPMLKKAIEAIEEELKAYADRVGGISLDNGKIWKAIESKRSGLNTAAIKEELGERYEQFTTVHTYKSYRQVKA